MSEPATAPGAATLPVTDATPADVIAALYAATARGDWDGAEALLSDELVITEAASLPFAGEYRGRGALRELYGLVMAGWTDPVVEHREITGGPHHAVALLTFHMTSKKTGRRLSHPVAEVFRVAQGRIVEIKPFYFDTAEISAER